MTEVYWLQFQPGIWLFQRAKKNSPSMICLAEIPPPPKILTQKLHSHGHLLVEAGPGLLLLANFATQLAMRSSPLHEVTLPAREMKYLTEIFTNILTLHEVTLIVYFKSHQSWKGC